MGSLARGKQDLKSCAIRPGGLFVAGESGPASNLGRWSPVSAPTAGSIESPKQFILGRASGGAPCMTPIKLVEYSVIQSIKCGGLMKAPLAVGRIGYGCVKLCLGWNPASSSGGGTLDTKSV